MVLLLRPSGKNKRHFRTYEKQAGIVPIRGRGIVEGEGLKIVWGDTLNREDVKAACQGIDWCFHLMALISPRADRQPEMARKVNVEGTRHLVEAIEAQDPEHIRMIYIGSVAMYGQRCPPVHVGRVGDPIIPSRYDHYANTKVEAELLVMESRIKHTASFRQTFIMIPDLFSLLDPIIFHQPLNSFMENITDRDSGRLMANCLEIPDDSDFWGGFYNVSGGTECRATFLEFLDRIYSLLGINYRKVMERRWFALKNFHMMFFEDSRVLDGYLHHWEGADTLEDYYHAVWRKFPWYLKAVAWFTKNIPPFRWLVHLITRGQLKRLASMPDGTLRWAREGNVDRINTFFGSIEQYHAIPGWDDPLPPLDHQLAYHRLDHGYDESKKSLDLDDLQQAAAFRGGAVVSDSWNGEMHQPIQWSCCQGHEFTLTPHTVLRGGHWCVQCISPPWDYQPVIKGNPFARQVLNPELI